MSLEHYTFLPDTAEVFFVTSFSDTNQLPLLSGMLTPAKSSESEQPTDGSLACECMKGMSDCSLHPSTPEKWTAFMQASLAKTLVSLESRKDLEKALAADFTEKSCVSLAWYDQGRSSWKTYQPSFLTDLEQFSETWPRWGMTVDGSAYAHPMSERRITETDGSYLPTPTAHNAKEGAYPSEGTRNTPTLAWVLGGKINPQFSEWMMGFPIGFTASRASAMPKSRSKPQPHGGS